MRTFKNNERSAGRARRAACDLALFVLVAALFAACGYFEDGIATLRPSGPPLIEDLEEAGEYLEGASGGKTVDDPVDLRVGGLVYPTDWPALLSVIAGAKKYVNLDISECTMLAELYGVFDSYAETTDDAGKALIVSLVLPAGATSVKKGTYYVSIFGSSRFPALKSVSGKGVRDIGEFAFSQHTTLTSVSFPAVTTIGDYAFKECSSLTEVDFPKAKTFNYGAFVDCTDLVSVDFPKATTIGSWAFGRTGLSSANFPAATTVNFYAFMGCIGLTKVNFPAATTISERAFEGCIGLTEAKFPAATTISYMVFKDTGTKPLTVTLGNTVPTLGARMFEGVSGSKIVTVKVPVGATGYGTTPANDTDFNWGNGFRGGGTVNGVLADIGIVNSNIKLTIQVE